MIKRPLRELFDAMYHGKLNFQDFLNSPVHENYKAFHPGNDEKKTIVKPSENLKTYHKFLNLFLIDFLPINEQVVFSYRKGFGALNAVEKHTEGKYFFQTDISSFFNSVDNQLIRNVISSGKILTPISDLDDYLERIIELICFDDSLPIGLPVSAPLSNAVLYNFDNELQRFCLSSGLTYSRYADDIIISAKVKTSLVDIDNIVQNNLHLLASKKLFINRSKTKFFQVGNKVKILGMMILPNGKISPDSKKKREIEILLHLYLTNREKFNEMILSIKRRSNKKTDGNEEEYSAVLGGNLNYVDAIDPDYTNKLRRKFGAVTVDTLMHQILPNRK